MGVLLAPLVPSSPPTLPILSRRLLLLDSAFYLALAALSAASAAANWPEVIVAVGGFLAALPAAAAAEEVAAAGGCLVAAAPAAAGLLGRVREEKFSTPMASAFFLVSSLTLASDGFKMATARVRRSSSWSCHLSSSSDILHPLLY